MNLLTELYHLIQRNNSDEYVHVEEQIKKSQHVIDQIRQTTTLQELHDVIHKIPITSKAEEDNESIIDNDTTSILFYVAKARCCKVKRILNTTYTVNDDNTCTVTYDISAATYHLCYTCKITSNTDIQQCKLNNVTHKNDIATKSIVVHNYDMNPLAPRYGANFNITFKLNQSIKTPIIIYISTEYMHCSSFINIFIMLQYITIIKQNRIYKYSLSIIIDDAINGGIDDDIDDDIHESKMQDDSLIKPNFSKLLSLITLKNTSHAMHNETCIEMCNLIFIANMNKNSAVYIDCIRYLISMLNVHDDRLVHEMDLNLIKSVI